MSILLPSLQSLYLQMTLNKKSLATGTGFVMDSPRGPVLITSRHNVTGRNNFTGEYLSNSGYVPDEIIIVHNKENETGKWVTRTEPILKDDSPLWIEHPTLGAKVDFVAIPLTNLNDVKLYPYTNPDTGLLLKISPSDVVSVIGFPFGMTGGGALPIWATGFVATELDINHNDLPTFLVDCRARSGQSGSAVVAHRNGGTITYEGGVSAVKSTPTTRFLGSYSGRINEQSDLGIVWKASAISELVNSIQPNGT